MIIEFINSGLIYTTDYLKTNSPIKMGKALFFVLACALIVAVIADYEFNDDTLEDFETEKRGMGRSLKKYKGEYI